MILVQSLACRRGGQLVFREIGFALETGALLRVTGANGSGKSSLLRALAGLLEPAKGSISWQGTDIAKDRDAHRQRLHYLGHLDATKPELTVGETLNYWRALHGDSAMADDPFDLRPLHDKPVRVLSAGQRRRLGLTRLTDGDAPLWLLDEPATSLDHAGQEILSGLIARHRARGGIAVVATHHTEALPDAQTLAMPGMAA